MWDRQTHVSKFIDERVQIGTIESALALHYLCPTSNRAFRGATRPASRLMLASEVTGLCGPPVGVGHSLVAALQAS
jgi:hypothetical protein